MMYTPGYKLLRAEFSMTFDDPWGDALDWWFAIAEFLHHNEPSMVPESWEFRDSPLHVPPWSPDNEGYTDEVIWEFYDDELITFEDALTFGKVLSRYLDILKAAGKDY